MNHETSPKPSTRNLEEPSPEFERAHSDEKLRISLMERAKKIHGPMNMVLVGLLAVTNISGMQQADIEEQREQAEANQDLHAADLNRRSRISQNLGPEINQRLAETASWNEKYTARRREIEQRPERHNFVHGFEQFGFSNEAIESALHQLLPAEWLSQENIASISVSNASPDSMAHYHMSGEAAAHCVRDQQDGHLRRGNAKIEVFRSQLEHMREGSRANQLLVYILIHEIAHANDPTYSATMDQHTRENSDDWLGIRMRNLSESHYQIGPHLAIQHDVNQLENEASRWLGNRYAYPSSGEGALPINYPVRIHNSNIISERQMQSAEYYAETMALVSTVNLPDAAYTSDTAWEVYATQALTHQRVHNPTFGRIAFTSERTSPDEQEDALAHVRFVHQLIPDIRTRNQAYNQFVRSGGRALSAPK